MEAIGFWNGTWWQAIDSNFMTQRTLHQYNSVFFCVSELCIALHRRQNANNDKIIATRKIVVICDINRMETIRKINVNKFQTECGGTVISLPSALQTQKWLWTKYRNFCVQTTALSLRLASSSIWFVVCRSVDLSLPVDLMLSLSHQPTQKWIVINTLK